MRHAAHWFPPLLTVCLTVGCVKTSLPGKEYRGPLPPADAALSASADRIRTHIDVLADEIGNRSPVRAPKGLQEAEAYVADQLESLDLDVHRQQVERAHDNLIVRFQGTNPDLPPLVVGAHYDTAPYTPGADDNASGVASLLEIAREIKNDSSSRTLLLVAWTHEEPPNFARHSMGSRIHAQSLKDEGIEVFAALSIETIGMYSTERGTQSYPFPFSLAYPNEGRFIGFIGNNRSRKLLKRVGRTFRESEDFPSRGAAAPGWITGIDWSDHRSYWAIGAPALMVTDTALFRNPHYHEPTDTPDIVDPDGIARVTRGLVAVIRDLREP